ncbi:predicted protein [Plenodomus lingam JN3]|uniref:Predicted protein n=1 Tax=Leptosphaeria maculans (strain JN3 / isolate v23.1.3 / race Av1-4-5-6-7-8) TaxID=985895 RepID=E5A997_LEPMJ|nr:predicted protein [Plenodomus lingam JN3]CBY00238.1 predicted protein [Plenodomus lingam JN3]
MSMIISEPCAWDGHHALHETDLQIHETASGMVSCFRELFNAILNGVGASFLAIDVLNNPQLAGVEISTLITTFFHIQKAVEEASDYYRSTHDHSALIGPMLLLARSAIVQKTIAIAVRCAVLKLGPSEVLKLYPWEWNPVTEEQSERGKLLMQLLQEKSLPKCLNPEFDACWPLE